MVVCLLMAICLKYQSLQKTQFFIITLLFDLVFYDQGDPTTDHKLLDIQSIRTNLWHFGNSFDVVLMILLIRSFNICEIFLWCTEPEKCYSLTSILQRLSNRRPYPKDFCFSLPALLGIQAGFFSLCNQKKKIENNPIPLHFLTFFQSMDLGWSYYGFWYINGKTR